MQQTNNYDLNYKFLSVMTRAKLTFRKAAEILKVSSRSIYRWTRRPDQRHRVEIRPIIYDDFKRRLRSLGYGKEIDDLEKQGF